LNVDKPPLDMKLVQHRLAQFARRATVWVTRAPTFVAKARLFPGAVFVVGADTAERLVAPRYYTAGEVGVREALAELRERQARFLVAGRVDRGGVFPGLADLPIPADFRKLFTAIPRGEFQVDISSTALRGSRNH
jgi:hypothetical protein